MPPILSLQATLDKLKALHETETNYIPLEISLEHLVLSPEDLDSLFAFVKDPTRKRLFLFKIRDDENNSNLLALTARHAVLNLNAKKNLQNTSNTAKINPLKQALKSQEPVRSEIQIRQKFHVEEQKIVVREHKQEAIEQKEMEHELIAIDFPELPLLVAQLAALEITGVNEAAAEKINSYPFAFKDGIISHNLPKGFYIDEVNHGLCYTDNPRKLPSALAPVLENPLPLAVPTLIQAKALMSHVADPILEELLNDPGSPRQLDALLCILGQHTSEVKNILQLLSPEVLNFIVPLLSKQCILGGPAHVCLVTRLLGQANQKINLEFLKNPNVQQALLGTRGIKNFQKLIGLQTEQKEWWNKLVLGHLRYNQESFDFNNFFEAYTQFFLRSVAEKKLTLPIPSPIQHEGHLLITLNRILDVLDLAENPQEQCLTLENLNWGCAGAHYAMTQKAKAGRVPFKQVSFCMNLENFEDSITNPEAVYHTLQDPDCNLDPWLFRYMGQHWKTSIRLTDIRAQLQEIQNLPWTPVQKNQLLFIMTCAFSNEATLNTAQWQESLRNCINLIQECGEEDQTLLLDSLSNCFRFKPIPSLVQIETLIKQCMQLKNHFPEKNFKDELLTPLLSLLENEGFALLNTIQNRVQKPPLLPEADPLKAMTCYITILHQNRANLTPGIITLLAKLNEPELNQGQLEQFLQTLDTLRAKKLYDLVLNTLSQINVFKSQTLPHCEQITTLIQNLISDDFEIPEAPDEAWLKDQILEHNWLPNCVVGDGNINELSDLIVETLVESAKMVATLDTNELITSLRAELGRSLNAAEQEKILGNLVPLIEALGNLITLLGQPNPSLDRVLETLALFEEKKVLLLEDTIEFRYALGQSKGKYLLSYLLAGQRSEEDRMTNMVVGGILHGLYHLFVFYTKEYFVRNKMAIKDLDAQTFMDWMKTFSDTHSIIFLFKDRLVNKSVLPALRKHLAQLNTNDPDFENQILEAASTFNDNQPAHLALQSYKDKVEDIVRYLNKLAEIKQASLDHFHTLCRLLSTPPLSTISYSQRQALIQKIHANPEALLQYLQLFTLALEENPRADEAAITQAINGLESLFRLEGLDADTQKMFFKMSVSHNLKSPNAFPLDDLNALKQLNLPKDIEFSLLKKIIAIFTSLPDEEAAEQVKNLVVYSQRFLNENWEMASLCISLLAKLSPDNMKNDLTTYQNILEQLGSSSPEVRTKLALILTCLASNKKDDTAHLSSLLDITGGLKRRPLEVIDRVKGLFETIPYPIAQNLNSSLAPHDSQKLQDYCSQFDLNPLAKTGEKRKLAEHFSTDRVLEALSSVEDLLYEADIPHALQLQLARQLTYIETLGYTDPLNPDDFQEPRKLTATSREGLRNTTKDLLEQFRNNEIPAEQQEIKQLELLAYLREVYFRSIGKFPHTTQMLVLLLSMHEPNSNLLMRIKTGEGKSIITPMLSVLQWAHGGTVDQLTANPTLLTRDYENTCEPFFRFLRIETALIQKDSPPEAYKKDGINCSTVEDMALFRLAAKELKKEDLITSPDSQTHVVIDESDDALLDQTALYNLVAAHDFSEAGKNNPAQWIYPLAYQFINSEGFRNLDPKSAWSTEEDIERFRLFLNNVCQQDIDKQNYLMASSDTQLLQWINASCKAAKLTENKHFIIQTIKSKDEQGQELTRKLCVPLIRSTPKTESIFTEGVHQALQALLKAERRDQAHYFTIEADPPVIASQSARGLILYYQNTGGRLLGISGTPGDQQELQGLASLIGTKALGIAPYAGEKRKKHPPVFTFSPKEKLFAIQKAIDEVKLPITKPNMDWNPDEIAFQTNEEKEAWFAKVESATEQWRMTQTQPILIINEDFDEAITLAKNLEPYKKAGFKIQLVTGQESAAELDRIIRQAGKANTITVGTAMLAKGIDINTGNHPKGLFVIQTYPDTERMSVQIAGRAARNGTSGEWLPIYEIKPPQLGFFQTLKSFFVPNYHQRTNEQAVEELKEKIKLQAIVNRLYTQAIDETQHVLMQQVQVWEELLLECYPNEPNLRSELYQWRTELFTKLTRAQETSVSPKEYEKNIAQFKNEACTLWETFREDKWANKAKEVANLSNDQLLKIQYLNQLSLMQELNVQSALQQKAKPFVAGSKALMHQSLQTTLLDKAGAVLDYEKPVGEMETHLRLTQKKQLLPRLIGEFCAISPQAFSKFKPQRLQNAFLPQRATSFIKKMFQQKHNPEQWKNQIIKTTMAHYQNELQQLDNESIKPLLEKLKRAFCNEIDPMNAGEKMSLLDQFRMHGLILTFCTVCKQSEQALEDESFILLKNHGHNIMHKLADHLVQQLEWVTKPMSTLFERKAIINAAHDIYRLATALKEVPQEGEAEEIRRLQEEKIHALYNGLQEHRLLLKDLYLLPSIGHTPTRQLINDALSAMDSLDVVPHCELEFRPTYHDKALSKHQLDQFRSLLKQTSAGKPSPVWNHLKAVLTALSQENDSDQSYLVQELLETIKRFQTYPAYTPYKKQLNALESKLSQSMDVLKQADGVKQDLEDSLLEKKISHFAELFAIPAEQVRIQRVDDGLQTCIQLQIQTPMLQEQFTGYQSNFLARIQREEESQRQIQTILQQHRQALVDLSDVNAFQGLPEKLFSDFEKLFQLKGIVNAEEEMNDEVNEGLPESIQRKLRSFIQLKQWDWVLAPVSREELNLILEEPAITEILNLLARQTDCKNQLLELERRLAIEQEQLVEAKRSVAEKKAAEQNMLVVHGEKSWFEIAASAVKSIMDQPVDQVAHLERSVNKKQTAQANKRQELERYNRQLTTKKNEYLATLKGQINDYLQQTSGQYLINIETESAKMETTLQKIRETENKKASYQTQRFFGISDLLAFEAKLQHEETNIPVPGQPEVERPFVAVPDPLDAVPELMAVI